ncbi:hypothetical protein Tco_1248318, partial [Tanacetum coccineum]
LPDASPSGYPTPDSSTGYRTVVAPPSFPIFLFFMFKNLPATKSTNEEDPSREEADDFFLAFAWSRPIARLS